MEFGPDQERGEEVLLGEIEARRAQEEQAILVLRIPTRETPAEEMTRSAGSPSRLWLGELPTSGQLG